MSNLLSYSRFIYIEITLFFAAIVWAFFLVLFTVTESFGLALKQAWVDYQFERKYGSWWDE